MLRGKLFKLCATPLSEKKARVTRLLSLHASGKLYIPPKAKSAGLRVVGKVSLSCITVDALNFKESAG